MTSLLWLKIILCARQLLNFIRHLTFWLLFHLWLLWGRCTLGARDSSSAVSGFCQGFGLRSKMCRPSANTENSRRKREKPLVPRVREMWILAIISTIWRHNDGNCVIISISFSPGDTPYNGTYGKARPKRSTFFQASGILKSKDFTRWSIWKGSEIGPCGL